MRDALTTQAKQPSVCVQHKFLRQGLALLHNLPHCILPIGLCCLGELVCSRSRLTHGLKGQSALGMPDDSCAPFVNGHATTAAGRHTHFLCASASVQCTSTRQFACLLLLVCNRICAQKWQGVLQSAQCNESLALNTVCFATITMLQQQHTYDDMDLQVEVASTHLMWAPVSLQ